MLKWLRAAINAVNRALGREQEQPVDKPCAPAQMGTSAENACETRSAMGRESGSSGHAHDRGGWPASARGFLQRIALSPPGNEEQTAVCIAAMRSSRWAIRTSGGKIYTLAGGMRASAWRWCNAIEEAESIAQSRLRCRRLEAVT